MAATTKLLPKRYPRSVVRVGRLGLIFCRLGDRLELHG